MLITMPLWLIHVTIQGRRRRTGQRDSAVKMWAAGCDCGQAGDKDCYRINEKTGQAKTPRLRLRDGNGLEQGASGTETPRGRRNWRYWSGDSV